MSPTYHLENGDRIAFRHPDTFEMPSMKERTALQPGYLVKLMFTGKPVGDHGAERMWVRVEQRYRNGYVYVGTLLNEPATLQKIGKGDTIRFGPGHVLSIEDAGGREASILAWVLGTGLVALTGYAVWKGYQTYQANRLATAVPPVAPLPWPGPTPTTSALAAPASLTPAPGAP